MSGYRLGGGLVDHSKALNFTFDGKPYSGLQGDTLASALLANGVQLMGRSFKYHRPRGVVTAGSEEPNALVELREGARQEPNTRATTIELYDGLVAKSQNRFPSLKRDFLAVNDLFSNFLSAGFYYKTFMWPKAFWEKLYEPAIRRAAGLGSIPHENDPDIYDKGFLHCDLLVIGSGPAGLMAALTAGRAGARVILAEEDRLLGGRLLAETLSVGDQSGHDWAAAAEAELAALPNVRIMPRTTVFGAYDHGIYGALERNADHLITPGAGKPRQTMWRIYSKRAIVAAGAIERHIGFANNDRPGIMMAGAVRAYANRWATATAKSVVVFTNNDDGYKTARDLMAKGVRVPAVVDTRPEGCAIEGTEVLAGATIIDTKGRHGVTEAIVQTAKGYTTNILCGSIAVSGGYSPNLGMTCHQRGRPEWRDDIAAFVPAGDLPPGQSVAGAARGVYDMGNVMADGASQAKAALSDLGIKSELVKLPEVEGEATGTSSYWYVPGKKRAWVDFQNDVTVKDVKLAHQEGYVSVEHLKRYTTLGMATDQGKTANVLGLAVMAEKTGRSIPDTGTTIYRPPYVPVPMGAFTGRSTLEHFRPKRLTPSHKWASEQGAVFQEVGLWMRAMWFPQAGETHWRESVDREVVATRTKVGICDVTTLGKIDVQGKDAGEFLSKLYVNGFAKLPVGKVRYGLMMREDGLLYDDGTAARFADDHYVVTTTTANAVLVYRNMDFARQCLFPDMDVQIISTTDAWAQFAVAGPNSRALLERIVDSDHDISNEAFPFMGCREITVCGGLTARLFRISFSGELAYEIAVPTRYGDALVRRMMEVGQDLGVTPYGLEALNVMRIEKGHVTGAEIDGRMTPQHMGLGKMVSGKKDCIGLINSQREALVDPNGPRLVGLRSLNGEGIHAGSHLMNATGEVSAKVDQGHVTSVCYSPMLKEHIGLGYVNGGDTRLGEKLRAVNPIKNIETPVEIVSAHFFDPEGGRLRD